MSHYAWIIDKDYLAEPNAEPGSLAYNAATVTGPSDAPEELIDLLKRSEKRGKPFRMYDDDGELYYRGRVIAQDGHELDERTEFGPLDDFGRGNAGCTDIRYWDNSSKKWKSL